jgi:hypothetical protein
MTTVASGRGATTATSVASRVTLPRTAQQEQVQGRVRLQQAQERLRPAQEQGQAQEEVLRLRLPQEEEQGLSLPFYQRCQLRVEHLQRVEFK